MGGEWHLESWNAGLMSSAKTTADRGGAPAPAGMGP